MIYKIKVPHLGDLGGYKSVAKRIEIQIYAKSKRKYPGC